MGNLGKCGRIRWGECAKRRKGQNTKNCLLFVFRMEDIVQGNTNIENTATWAAFPCLAQFGWGNVTEEKDKGKTRKTWPLP